MLPVFSNNLHQCWSAREFARDRRLTRYSSVNPISRIDFDPAQTTATGVSLSDCRSLEMSKPEQRRQRSPVSFRNSFGHHRVKLTSFRSPMNSSDSSGTEHLDPCQMRNGHRPAHRRTPIQSFHYSSPQLPPSHFPQPLLDLLIPLSSFPTLLG